MKATASKVRVTLLGSNVRFLHPVNLWLAFFLWVLVAGCKSKEEPPEEQGTDILFYPLSNTYYDVDRNLFYVYDSLAMEWQQKKELTPARSGGLGRSVLLEKVSDPVFLDNEQHKLVYGPLLYSSPEEIKQKYREDSLSHRADSLASAPQPDTVAIKEERKRSKFGKFLRKIFGKKDRSD